MYLKYLELYGFKSFPDRVKLSFGKGLTAVVGPNGSGKSNISDAVRWVLGEQSTKTLRGDKMQDVIFGGTQKRKPMGFSQVVLTIGNENRELAIDADEIYISRKLYRDGESEYKINGNTVRLRDVHELFMDTGLGRDGYSMIGQGKIAEIIGAKSTQRREIFEEAAGISKFRYRKNEAQRKLLQTEENLLRLRDIVTELEERVGPLKNQSEKAKKYVVLAEENKKLELSLWTARLSEMTAKLRELSDELQLGQLEEKKAEQLLAQIEQQTETLYGDMQQIDIQAEALRGKNKETEEQIAAADARIAVAHNDIYHNEQNILRLQKENELAKTSEEQFLLSIAQKRDEQNRLKESLAEIQARAEQSKTENAQTLQRIVALEEQLADKKEEENRLAFSAAEKNVLAVSYQNTLDDIQERADAIEQSQEQKTERLLALKKEKEQCDELVAHLRENIASLENAAKGLRMKYDARQKKEAELLAQQQKMLQELKDKEHRAALLSEMERNLEGFAHSVKYILSQGKSGALRGIHGALSSLLQVEAKYLTAIETAAYSALQNIVVENEAVAKQAIEMLKSAKNGRATFLPLSAVRGKRLQAEGLESCSGFLGVGSDLVRFDPKYKGIVDSVLGRIVVVESLDDAVLLAKKYAYAFRVVTLDGQVVNTGGSMTGGSTNRSTGLLSRRSEILALQKQAAEQKEKADAFLAAIETAKQELAAVNAQLMGTEAEQRTASEDCIRYESEQKRIEAMLADLQNDQTQAKQQKEKLAAQRAEMQTALEENQQQQSLLAAQQGALTQELEALQSEYQEILTQKERFDQETAKLYEEKTEIDHQIELLEQSAREQLHRREEQTRQTEQIFAEIDDLTQKNQQILGEIEQIKTETEQKRNEIAEQKTRISALLSERQQLEQKNTELRQQQTEALLRKEKAAGMALRVQDGQETVQKEFDSIVSRIWDEYEMTRSEAEGFVAPAEDIPATTRALSEIKGKIRALGTVNLEAIEEYEQVSSRYRFLTEQMGDVERSKKKLEELIQNLTVQMREMFSSSFQQINRHFSQIFTELFGGGKAHLELSAGEDVLESGIEIFVQPPGKIIKNLASLSGGEQAFVAIAIYFAILKVRPAPFCLLDEIEAALDDVNVGKFAEYLTRLNENTQFIAITHRRGTMEYADVLYGVTMEEEGVSKLLELDVSEIESKLGMKQI